MILPDNILNESDDETESLPPTTLDSGSKMLTQYETQKETS